VLSQDQCLMLKKMFCEGVSQRVIANRLGLSQASVSRAIVNLGLSRDNINKTVADDELIKRSHLSSVDIARELGISHQAVQERIHRLGIERSKDDIVRDYADKSRRYCLDLSHFDGPDQIGCYYLGLLYADGCLRARNGRLACTLSLVLKERGVLQQLLSDLNCNKKIETVYTNSWGKRYAANRIVFDNIHFGRKLCELGMRPGPDYKRSLPEIRHWPDFVRGFLDGDGYVSIRKNKHNTNFLTIGFSLTYRGFGVQLQDRIASETGVMMNGPYKTKSIYAMLATYKKAESIAAWLWSDPVRAMPRKYNRYRSFIDGESHV